MSTEAGSRCRAAGLLVAGLLAAASLPGCARPRVELGEPRTVEAGVPVVFGAAGGPLLTWDFGEGRAGLTGREVSHAFARAGQYTVRALHEGDVVDTLPLTVVPRPVLRAVPQNAEAVLYLPAVRGNLNPVLDFFERLVGPEAVQRFLDANPLLQPAFLLSESGEAEQGWLDLDEGLALYGSQEGLFQAAIGVTDAGRALEEMARGMALSAGSPRVAADGSLRLTYPEGEELALWEDRGYLYFAFASEPETAADSLGRSVEAVRRSPAAGFEGRAGTGAGKLVLAPTQLRAASAPLEGQARAWFAAKVTANLLELEGLLELEKPLWSAEGAARSPLLDGAPEGPIAALSVSADPRALGDFLLGAGDSETRRRVLGHLSLTPAELEAVHQALDGTLAGAAYFDAPAFLAQLLADPKNPSFRGSVVAQAGLRRSAPFARLLSAWAQATGLSPVARGGGAGKRVERFAGHLLEQPAALELGESRLSLELGGSPPKMRGALGAALTQRFGEDAFGKGHVTLLLDVGQLRRELQARGGLPPDQQAQLMLMQGLASAFVDQLTPVDHLFVDLWPSKEGARLRGRIELRPRTR